MLKEVSLIHTAIRSHKICIRIVKWKISASYLVCWTWLFARWILGEKWNETVHVLYLQCMRPRSRTFYLLCKTLWRGTWAALPTLHGRWFVQCSSLFTPSSENCSSFLCTCPPVAGISLVKCKTCTNLNLYCGQIVQFRWIRGSRKRRTPHQLPAYSLALFWLPFRLSLLSISRLPCADISEIFLMFRIRFHYEFFSLPERSGQGMLRVIWCRWK